MSRIYEALLKEMQAQEAPEAEPLFPKPPFLEASQGEEEPRHAQKVASPAVGPSVPPPSRPLRLDALRQSCARPRWKLHQDYMVLFNKDSFDPCAEKFRTLRTSLNRLREKKHIRTLLITSSVAGEGKTFVSMNLARVIARQHERQALLIDTDLRAPRLHTTLGAPCTPGLSDYLRGQADESSIMQMGTTENLFFIPAGAPVSNPGELLAGNGVRSLVERLSPLFDWIILDGPPLLLASDATLLSAVCDGTILVVRAGTTPSNMAQTACQELKDSNLLGIVLNGAEDATYGAYGYGYGNYGVSG